LYQNRAPIFVYLESKNRIYLPIYKQRIIKSRASIVTLESEFPCEIRCRCGSRSPERTRSLTQPSTSLQTSFSRSEW